MSSGRTVLLVRLQRATAGKRGKRTWIGHKGILATSGISLCQPLDQLAILVLQLRLVSALDPEHFSTK